MHRLRDTLRLWFSLRVPAGRHTVSWDGRTLRGERALPGVYIYELAVAGERLARKMWK